MEASEKNFIDQQNRFRGLVSEFKSRRFVEDRKIPPARRFRTDLKEVLLDARSALSVEQYGPYLAWVHQQIDSQLPELARNPTSYDELAGVYAAKAVSLERELRWVGERLSLDSSQLKTFRKAASLIEALVIRDKIEDALAALSLVDAAFGVSIWSVQLRIALEQLAGGLERQKRYTAEVRAVYRRGLLGFIAYHTSVRNEDKSTPGKFAEHILGRIERHGLYSDEVKTYLRFKLAGEWGKESSDLACVLNVEQSHNIIDVYETFVSIGQELIKRPELNDERQAVRERLRLLPEDLDFRLTKLATALGDDGALAHLPARRTDVSDALFAGSPREAVAQFRASRDASTVDVWALVYGAFAFSSAKHRALPATFHASDALRLLRIGISGSEDADEARTQLEKLATNLKGLPFAAGLAEVLSQLRRIRPTDPWRPWLIGLHSPTVGVEDLSSQQHAKRNGSTSAAWRRLDSPGAIGPLRPMDAMFEGAGLVLAGRFADAAEVLRPLAQSNVPDGIRSLLTNLLLHALTAETDHSGCIELLADQATRRPQQKSLLPIAATLDSLRWPDYRDAVTPFAASISLHLLWTDTEREITLSQLRFATGAALRACGVAKPSDLLTDADLHPKHQLVYFLREVCEPPVLDVLRSMKSTRAVLEERQAIASGLRTLDPSRASEYGDEVMNISGELTMAEGTWIVDHSRIHVDATALGRFAARELSEDFGRYQDLLAVDVGPQESFEDVLKELASNGPLGRQAAEAQNEADAVLLSMMQRLAEEFLTNPVFGLDFYLSKRIRHQSFIGRIRGPLEFANLITTRESETGPYHRNDHWLQKFTCSTTEQVDAINAALEACASDFDEILRDAKDRRFQIRSPEHPDGIIGLELTPQIIRLTKSIARLDPDRFSSFYGVAVAILWAALEPALTEARRFITQDLKTRVTERLERARAEVRAAAGQDPAFYLFDIEFGARSTEVQRALDEAAGWFTHTDVETHKRTFTLQEAVQIGLENALKSQRAFEPKVSHNIEGTSNVSPTSLVLIHDAMFVALDNARAHSGHKAPNVDVLVCHNANHETLTLEILSDCRAQHRVKCEKQLHEIRRLIDGGKPTRRTRREGGSGLLKLSAVAKQSSKGLLEFGFTEEGRFRLAVTYSFVIQPMPVQAAA